VVLKAANRFQEHNGSLIAAGLSFFTVFSLPPFIMTLLWIAGFVFEAPAARARVIDKIAALSNGEIANYIDSLIHSVQNLTGGVSIVSILLLLWGASKIFLHLQNALNVIWKTETPPPSVWQGVLRFALDRLLAIGMIIGLGGLVVAFLAIDILLAGVFAHIRGASPYISLASSFGVVAVAFACLYKWLPEAKVKWKEAWWGAAVGATLLTAGRYVLLLYFQVSNVTSAAGATGSIIAVLLWVYYSMCIVLFGAEAAWVEFHPRDTSKR
jgi:membrane protein